MATLSVDNRAWNDPRFIKFVKASRYGVHWAAGILNFLWQNSQEMGVSECTEQDIHIFCRTKASNKVLIPGLLEAGYLRKLGDNLYQITGNKRRVEKIQHLRKMSRQNAEKRWRKSPPPTTPKKEKVTTLDKLYTNFRQTLDKDSILERQTLDKDYFLEVGTLGKNEKLVYNDNIEIIENESMPMDMPMTHPSRQSHGNAKIIDNRYKNKDNISIYSKYSNSEKSEPLSDEEFWDRNCPKNLDQILSVVEPKKKPKPAAKKNPTSGVLVKNFIAGYCDAYKTRYGVNPPITGKDSGIAKTTVNDFGLEKSLKYVKAYLEVSDSWFEKRKYDLETFRGNLKAIALYAETGKFTTNTQAKSIDLAETNKQNLAEYWRRQAAKEVSSGT